MEADGNLSLSTPVYARRMLFARNPAVTTPLVGRAAWGLACLLACATVSVAADALSPRPASLPSGVTRVGATPIGPANAVRLEGSMTEGVWATAPRITGFVQREPREGAAPSFATEAQVAYDESAIYVAVRAFDPNPDKIVGILTRRDDTSPSDWIRVIIDSYHDRRTAYEFAVNPAGVKSDQYWFGDTNSDSSWDAVWDVKVFVDGEGWRAVFRIPFSQLRFDPNKADTFGFAVVRQIGRLNEISTWPLLAKSASGYVSSFGELTGLHPSRTPKRLELTPYGVGRVTTQPVDAGDPFTKSLAPGLTAGADVKYALTPGLTLTATVNPDFGQVEADPAVVNLTGFETLFQERRPFFVEGSGIFRFDTDCNDGRCTGLFYSRRIGRSPHIELDTPDNGFLSAPSQTTILGAAKLTGRVGGFSIGALNALTTSQQANLSSGLARFTQTVEPFTSYSVVRATREFKSQSSVGFMLTATNRHLDADTASTIPGQAYTGGVDWRVRFGKNLYEFAGYLAGSTVRGSPEAIQELQEDTVHTFQRPDQAYLKDDPARPSLDGYAGLFSLNKIGGQKTRFNSNVSFKSPGFDINDVGYVRRVDQITYSNWFQWRHNKPWHFLRSFSLNLNQWSGWNYGGDRLFLGGNVNWSAVFTSNWAIGMGYNLDTRGFADRLTRGGPGGLVNRFLGSWGYINSDDRKRISVQLMGFSGGDGLGSRAVEINPSLTYRPAAAVAVSAGIDVTRNVDDSQWIENLTDPGNHYVFGHLNQTTVSLTTRVNYTVSPTLSIQIYAAPFVSAGAYTHFKELVNGRAGRYQDRYAPYAYAGNPDLNYRSFRTTNVLRWDYKPGSALYVVWQQGREETLDRGDFQFGRDFGRVFAIPARNVFLVKWSYWLNL
jgi:hypothetical protein